MYFFYNLFLLIIIIVASPFWIFKVLTTEKHRRGFIEKTGILPKGIKEARRDGKRVHIHAVSVGEVNAVTPFIKEFKKSHPDIRLFLSTVTPAGYDLAHKKIPEADHIIYFPFDLPWIARKVVNTIRPNLFITVETELWPNFLRQVKRSGASTVVINGRISPKTLRGYTFVRPFMKKALANVDLFCMQSEEDARRIRAIGALDQAIRVTGNMKYDQRFIDIDEKDLIEKRRLFGIGRDDRIIIAGSTHRGEDGIIVESYKACNVPHPLMADRKGEGEKGFLCGRLRLIIVPRHPERAGEIEEIVRGQGFEPVRRTALGSAGKDKISDNHIVIVDTIGELAALYSMATVVIIGGSFIPHGGQNPLEAMYYKKPVIFGPYMFNFREITEEILKNGTGIQIEKPEDLTERLKELLNDPKRQKEMGENGYQIIQKNRGAVKRNLVVVEKIIEDLSQTKYTVITKS